MPTYTKYHINPHTGDVSGCQARGDNCPFGSRLIHFGNEGAARLAASNTLQEFHDFTSRSVVPQDPEWFTVHVFPIKDERGYSTALRRAAAGQHLVLENGWVLERIVDRPIYNWQMLDTRLDEYPGPEVGEYVKNSKFIFDLTTLGGRIESTEGLKPYEIQWSR